MCNDYCELYFMINSVYTGARCNFNLKLQNGKIYYYKRSNNYRILAFFHCNDGYELHGYETNVCRYFQWSLQVPHCQGIITIDNHVTPSQNICIGNYMHLSIIWVHNCMAK